MFTPEDRRRLRSTLLESAAIDKRITGAAITGSGATDREDAWSQIDLAFGVAPSIDVPNVFRRLDFAHVRRAFRFASR
jgi:hypothetical protein